MRRVRFPFLIVTSAASPTAKKGAAASSLAHVLVRLGHPRMSVRDEGPLEWCADHRLPLELG